MVLYKYKLSDPYIFTKYGSNDPERINFEKLVGNSLFLFHLDVYKNKTERLKDLIDWSIENEIDIFIPWSSQQNDYFFQEKDQHRHTIKEILDKYEYAYYDFSDIKYDNDSELQKTIIESTKPILRDSKLRNIFD
jgi:hypothetical protein